MSICILCKSNRKDELLYGKFVTTSGSRGFGAHTYCLYLSSNLPQNGHDKQGLYGFLTRDIRKETCCYCKKKYAGISCCEKRCRLSFHLICGLENGAENQYCHKFNSYCHKHLTKVKYEPPPYDELCCICYEGLFEKGERFSSLRHIKAHCCSNGWFHKMCVQTFAITSGYFFKCPLCNNNTLFREKLAYQGIFIPNRDAAWEFEPNAYAELLERPDECLAVECKNDEGRKSTSIRNPLIFCNTCGSKAIHKNCLINDGRKEFQCHDCAPIVQSLDSKKIIKLDSNDEDSDIDVCKISDEEDNSTEEEDFKATVQNRILQNNNGGDEILPSSNDYLDYKQEDIFAGTTDFDCKNAYLSAATSCEKDCKNASARTSEDELLQKNLLQHKQNTPVTISSDTELSEAEESTSIAKNEFYKFSCSSNKNTKRNLADEESNSYVETSEEEISPHNIQRNKNRVFKITTSDDDELETEESMIKTKKTIQKSSSSVRNGQQKGITSNISSQASCGKQIINCDDIFSATTKNFDIDDPMVSNCPPSDNKCTLNYNLPTASSSIRVKNERIASPDKPTCSHICRESSPTQLKLRSRSVFIPKREQTETKESCELNCENILASTTHHQSTKRTVGRPPDGGRKFRNNVKKRQSYSESLNVSCIAHRTRKSLKIINEKKENSKDDEQPSTSSALLSISCIAKRTRLSYQKSLKTKKTKSNDKYFCNNSSESSGDKEGGGVCKSESESEIEGESSTTTSVSNSKPTTSSKVQNLPFPAVGIKNRKRPLTNNSNDSNNNNNNENLAKRFNEEPSLLLTSNSLKSNNLPERVRNFKRDMGGP
uniref:PHD-type domain-containing protein n=1 Tax=Glossina brevipalpis TaxID=37001 RepID=A0A1A9X574_9MUSC